MKLIIKPQFIDWDAAQTLAARLGGRLITFKEMTRWSKNEPVELDVWIGYKMGDRAQYFDSKRQDIRFKPRNEKCLLVMLVDPKRVQALRRDEELAHRKQEHLRKGLKRLKH